MKHALTRLTLLSLATLGVAVAQPASTPGGSVTRTGTDSQDETLVLNPFTVSTDQDRGYAASSTLAGTRLNTSLRDIAAAITVVTPEYMADLGVFTLQDVLSFTPNAELNVATFNSQNNSGESARIRGVRVHESTQDFFPSYLPVDVYNIEQISINRGPNSLLFGVGNPAGTLTGVSKRANFNNRYSVSASVDDRHGWRASSDFNQVIVPGRLALRVALLHRDTTNFIQPAYWRENRQFAATTLQILKRRNWTMTLRVNAELAQADRVLPNLRTATDVITPWIASGSNLVSGVQPAPVGVVLPAGVIRAAGTNQLVVVDGSPTAVPMLNWINTTRGGISTFQNRTLSAASPIPYNKNYNGPTRQSDYTGRNYHFFLEQELGGATQLELAYGQSTRNIYWVRSEGGDSVFVDTNRTLPNGNANPNAGRYYTQGTNRVQEQTELDRQLRLTATHLLDLRGRGSWGAWVGQHRFAMLLSHDFATTALNDMFEVNGTPLAGYPARLDNAQNRIFRRSYLFLGEGDVWQSDLKFRDIAPVNSGGVASRYYQDRAVRNNEETDSLVLAVQSKTLKNRLATTLGYRWDDLKGYTLNPAVNIRNAIGEAQRWQELPLLSSPSNTLRNGTFTGGAVLHLLPQLSLQYNQSETSTGAGNQKDMYARPLPVSMGTGQDYGIKFALFGDRLTGSLTRYRSSQDNQLISSVQGLGASLNDMGRTLNIPVLEAVQDPRDTQDIVSRGYELELIYNPTPSWRISTNVSKNNNILTNVNSRAARFLEEYVYPLEKTSGSVVLANGSTVAQQIANYRISMRNSKTAVEGRQAEELREWNANFVTSYRVPDGRFKGLAFGGNVQYRGSSFIGAIVDPVTNIPDFAHPIKGPAYTIVGAHVRYDFRIAQRYNVEFGLNVRNLLDDYPYIAKSASSTDGAVIVYQQLEPRTVMFTTTVRF